MKNCLLNETDKSIITAQANKIRQQLNPHPAGQQESNVPMLNGEPLPGIQHKYNETVLKCHVHPTRHDNYFTYERIRRLRTRGL